MYMSRRLERSKLSDPRAPRKDQGMYQKHTEAIRANILKILYCNVKDPINEKHQTTMKRHGLKLLSHKYHVTNVIWGNNSAYIPNALDQIPNTKSLLPV